MSTGDRLDDSSTVRTESGELRRLEAAFEKTGLLRRFRRAAYDPGDLLEYEVLGVFPATPARVTAEVERFVGGGFAGQVYRVRLLALESRNGDRSSDGSAVAGDASTESPVAGLEIGRPYAVKILTPPSAFARGFRNLLYFLGYQAHFGAQVLPSAVRVGVLWQKLIRRAMAIEIGDETSVCDTYATFYDAELASHGEINEWIEGRIWKFEADDRLFERWDFARRETRRERPGDEVPGTRRSAAAFPAQHNSPEYVGKKRFMQKLVDLLHRMGAGELARQYEWWTCKSTPNVLKRISREGDPEAGLTAVDFRAGLTLLPFLPMSPADVKLILKGLLRGRLVQFDRCDMSLLREFVGGNPAFEDLGPAIVELETQTEVYRSSQPDLTHHHVRLLTSARLRASIREGIVTSWRSLGWLDEEAAERLRSHAGLFSLLYVLSLVPFLGPSAVGLWGRDLARRHVRRCWTDWDYLLRAMRGTRTETLVRWSRDGRVSAERAEELVDRPARFWRERMTAGWLPPKWHRFLADWSWATEKIRSRIDFTLSFLKQPEFREKFLLDEVRRGREDGMLTPAETERIESQIKDPFIQKYLRCLAVHLCTVPVTQVVMVLVGAAVTAYCVSVRGMSWPESLGLGTAAAAAIQLLPISPGSITRGVFVLYLMIRERDIRNYYIAAPISFLHVVG
jgi:hypothetical protein